MPQMPASLSVRLLQSNCPVQQRIFASIEATAYLSDHNATSATSSSLYSLRHQLESLDLSEDDG